MDRYTKAPLLRLSDPAAGPPAQSAQLTKWSCESGRATGRLSSLTSVEAVESGVRLADLVASFSLATDLGLGQPMEHVLRAWLIASRLGEEMGLGTDERRALYYVATLGWAGCVADTPEVAAWFGDDIAFRGDSFGVDRRKLSMAGFSIRHVGLGYSALQRLRLGVALMASGGAAVQRGLMAHCVTTAHMAERLGLGSDVCNPLQQVFTRWDGKGVPSEISGEEIFPTVRLFHLADTVEVTHRTGGVDAAVDLARSWRGTQFDPQVVDSFCSLSSEVLDDLDDVNDWTGLIEQEPSLQEQLVGDQLDRALEAIGDFTDLRSPCRAGHSRAVANLAAAAGEQYNLPDHEVRMLRRAGLVHDLGLHGVPATILDKAGPLRANEFERIRMWPYYTERMLVRTPALRRVGALATLVNERLDGSGYYRGLSGGAIPAAGRILAAADAYQAMIEPRPYRPARPGNAAADALKGEVRSGRLESDAVDAVLAAAGQRRGKRRQGPSGLTEREVEVLVLIARGASTKDVAGRLGISAHTAGTHVERIYTKIGASSRATATLFASQHGLLDGLEPLDL